MAHFKKSYASVAKKPYVPSHASTLSSSSSGGGTESSLPDAGSPYTQHTSPFSPRSQYQKPHNTNINTEIAIYHPPQNRETSTKQQPNTAPKSLRTRTLLLDPPHPIRDALDTVQEKRTRLSQQLYYAIPEFCTPAGEGTKVHRIRLLKDSQLEEAAQMIASISSTSTIKAALVLITDEKQAMSEIADWLRTPAIRGDDGARSIRPHVQRVLEQFRKARLTLLAALMPAQVKGTKAWRMLLQIDGSLDSTERDVRQGAAALSQLRNGGKVMGGEGALLKLARSEMQACLDSTAKDLAAVSLLIQREHGAGAGLDVMAAIGAKDAQAAESSPVEVCFKPRGSG